MVAAQAGDATAYRHLLSEIDVWLKRYYSRRLPPPMIDDVTQNVLLAIHAKRRTYDPSRPFIAWLVAIAHCKWVDALQSLQAHGTISLDEDLAVPADEAAATSAFLLESLLVSKAEARAG